MANIVLFCRQYVILGIVMIFSLPQISSIAIANSALIDLMRARVMPAQGTYADLEQRIIEPLELALRLYPANVVARVHLGEMLAWQGRYEDAAAQWRLSSIAADQFLMSAMAHVNADNLAEAQHQLTALAGLLPNDPRIDWQMGVIHYAQRELEAASDSLTLAAQSNNWIALDEKAASQAQAGIVYLDLQRPQEAIDFLQESLNSFDSNGTAVLLHGPPLTGWTSIDESIIRYYLGVAYQRSGQTDKAWTEFEQVKNSSWATFQKGIILLEVDTRVAEAQFERALSEESSLYLRSQMATYAGYAYESRGDNLAGRRWFHRALEMRPGAWENLTLGASYVKTNQYAEAIPFLERAVALDPNDAGFRSWLARGLSGWARQQLTEGNREGAVVSLQHAIELYPDNPDLIRQLEEIEAEP